MKKLLLAGFCLMLLAIPGQWIRAQTETGQSQQLSDRVSPDGIVVYDLSDLMRGQTLYVLAEATSDNLDPFVGLLTADTDVSAWQAAVEEEAQGVGAEVDLVDAISDLYDKYYLAWDDDSGPGYSAALTYTVPDDGDYYLLVSASGASLLQPVFGNYDLFIGIDDPAVLTGQVNDDALIAVRDQTLSPENSGVGSISGVLSEDKQSLFLGLVDVQAGDRLDVLVEPAEANTTIGIALLDFGSKPLAIRLIEEGADHVALSYVFTEAGSENTLRLFGCCGEYELTAGLNAPEVLDGKVEDEGSPVLETAIPIKVGFRMQQISTVDQQSENFSIVGTLRMEWRDPRLAFSAEECQCFRKVFTERNFSSFYAELGDYWPDFTFFNQQGRRDIQNQELVISPNGQVVFIERFTGTFQAPAFDFRDFPFDTQPFFIQIDGIWSEDLYRYEDNVAYTGLGESLGEEEWVVDDHEIAVSSVESTPGLLVSRYAFNFDASRNVSFYVLRIFLPILVVILVSWISFFLRDFDKRVDVAAGNLLLFIAFNFTISDDLPRLGYLTFMDAVLIVTFIITALVVVYNVVLKRVEIAGNGSLAQRIDAPMIWLYPLIYALVIFIAYYAFFLQPTGV